MDGTSPNKSTLAGKSRPRSGRISPRLRLHTPRCPSAELNLTTNSGTNKTEEDLLAFGPSGRISTKISFGGTKLSFEAHKSRKNSYVPEFEHEPPKEPRLLWEENLPRAIFVKNLPKDLETRTLEDISTVGVQEEPHPTGSIPKVFIYTPLCARPRILKPANPLRQLNALSVSSTKQVKPLFLQKGGAHAGVYPRGVPTAGTTQSSLRPILVQKVCFSNVESKFISCGSASKKRVSFSAKLASKIGSAIRVSSGSGIEHGLQSSN